jgi:hypothetical protein
VSSSNDRSSVRAQAVSICAPARGEVTRVEVAPLPAL